MRSLVYTRKPANSISWRSQNKKNFKKKLVNPFVCPRVTTGIPSRCAARVYYCRYHSEGPVVFFVVFFVFHSVLFREGRKNVHTVAPSAMTGKQLLFDFFVFFFFFYRIRETIYVNELCEQINLGPSNRTSDSFVSIVGQKVSYIRTSIWFVLFFYTHLSYTISPRASLRGAMMTIAPLLPYAIRCFCGCPKAHK